MPYIDIELEKADFRVILGDHNMNDNPRQLPPGTTGLILEGPYTDPEDFYSGISTPTGIARTQFVKLIKAVQAKEIPIVAADPLVDVTEDYKLVEESARAKETFINFINGLPFVDSVLLTFADYVLTRSTKKIDTDGWVFRRRRQVTEYLEAQEMSDVTLRNLTFAQRAWKTAEHQLGEGIQRPFIVLACGLDHSSAAGKLLMSPGERIASIKSHPHYGLYFSPANLADILYTKYNANSKIWEKGTIRDVSFISS